MKNNRDRLGVSTNLGREYTSAERDMLTALCLACPDLLAIESPKDTREGEIAPMEGVICKCNHKNKAIELSYVYEAKTRNFNFQTLFGKYGGRAIIKSSKLGNCQRASMLFGVPCVLLMRLQGEAFFLIKRLTNANGTFTFDYNEQIIKTRQPCVGGYEETFQTLVPMQGAKKCPLNYD